MTPIQQLMLGVGASKKTYVDNVFSNYLFEGNGSGDGSATTAKTITNNIDLTNGGLVWIKRRDGTHAHVLSDTVRGVQKTIESHENGAEYASTGGITSFTSTGFTLANDDHYNGNGFDMSSWTFRKAPGFLDIVSFQGDNTVTNQTINHNLKSVPGMILLKPLNGSPWRVYHRSLGTGDDKMLCLSTNAAAHGFNMDPNNNTFVTVTSTNITIRGQIGGVNYVGYLFAHNDGDGEFGESGDKDIIKCGSYTGNGNADGPEINLGWEPQWVLFKYAGGASSWFMYDAMRGIVTGGDDPYLNADQNSAEVTNVDAFEVTPTGFKIKHASDFVNKNGGTIIYTAIRRPDFAVGKPAEAGTDVFAMDTGGATPHSFDSGFPVDFVIYKNTSAGNNWYAGHRLRGDKYIVVNDNESEATTGGDMVFDSNTQVLKNISNTTQAWMWKRSSSFDVVAYKAGSASTQVVNHSLGRVPEMMWVRRRSGSYGGNWYVYHKAMGNERTLKLENANEQSGAASTNWNNTTPSATTFTLGENMIDASNGSNWIATLFASVDGISSVGSWTGNGSSVSRDITCGFNPRFVLIKRYDSSANWYVYDSLRGSGDNYMELNTNTYSSGWDILDYSSTGFSIKTSNADINANGGSYIYYAHA